MNYLHSSDKTALRSLEEFMHSPILAGAFSSTIRDVPPPPHRQLLSDEPASFEGLKGYDHTQGVMPYENTYDTLDGYDESYESVDIDSSFRCRKTLSAVKEEGGGSWLLGFLVGEEEEDNNPPGLVRDEDSSSGSEDDASVASEEEAFVSKPPPKRRGVSFDAAVVVRPIPHCSDLSPIQRRRMYCSRQEIHRNKIRNKREFRYDGYDWRNATEEWGMGVDMVTGELVHPAHEEAMVHPALLTERQNAGGWR